MIKLTAAPAFNDNYIWFLSTLSNDALIVDPGDAKATVKHLKQHHYTPIATLLTHHHSDHISGIKTLHNLYPTMKIYGPQEVINALPALPIIPVTAPDSITLLGRPIEIIATPGHTRGHVSYYTKPYLFCGDVLFSAGCGRVFEGTHDEMYDSLSRLAQLDNKTLICSAHEYTLGNLKFAHSILPNDVHITQRLHEVQALRKKGEMTLPTTLALEKKINLFLRCNEAVLKNKLNCPQPNLVFAELRTRKDHY